MPLETLIGVGYNQAMEKTFIAYMITNNINGKRYIGITGALTLAQRWRGHRNDSRRGSNGRLHNAIRKYGVNSFSVEHIASARTWADLTDLEVILIAQHGTFHLNNTGYNMTRGGEGCHGMIFNEESRKKMSDRQLRRFKNAPQQSPSPELLKRLFDIQGSPEVRARKSVQMKARWAAVEDRACPLDIRARISATLTGRKSPDGTGAKISGALKGKPKSQAGRDNMRAARQARALREKELGITRTRTAESNAKTSAAFARKRDRLVFCWAIASFYKPRQASCMNRVVVTMVRPVQLSLVDLLL